LVSKPYDFDHCEWLVELAPYIKEDVLSKRAKAMTEFKKYVKQSERQFEILTMINE